ncbi:prolipoprotein diacylglyceryl transferase [Desulfotomaculum copahuensis]|uniref:Phosphatidylglycerol--prolipoprotein diacylglyceryl transferase n=1 Tax=Desulfotomaculum copahuensis TaxID=1838280 RepID=A0A1B7LJP8_9FIRM|nr:prolipoprotein diacylglyceryl transferase [Desulfotomaculum copahuensis]OAT86773.1 prolipoprotein diacylglyceryl transferase [Desulfotomaculum copahuensis]
MINPVAIHLGPLPIRWYGILMASAFVIGIILASRRARQNKLDPNHILNMITLIIPAAIIGARLYYVLFEWSSYQHNPLEALAVWHGGLAIHGGLIGGALAGLWYARRHRLKIWQLADIMAPSLILGQAIGRWGNFINQEAHGGPVSASFMAHFPAFIRRQMFINGQYYQPTFLYESLWDLAVFIFLLWYWPRRRFRGEVAMLYLGLYSVGRFVVEGMRTDSLMLGPIRVAQLVSVVLVLVCIAGIFYGRTRAAANPGPVKTEQK